VTHPAYPALWQLFGAYFHQDWDLSGPDWQSVLAEYVDTAQPETALQAAGELAALLRDIPDDAELRRIVPDDLGCEYLPEPGGLTMREWLMEMQRQLAG
jgi:hypothetical protein